MPEAPEERNDEELMARLCAETDPAGAEAAFGEVFARYQPRVVSWCYQITGNRDSARDLSQEVFLKAWRHRHAFRGDSRLSTWLFAIARNHCLTALSKRKNEPVQMESALHSRVRDLSAVEPDRAAERGDLCLRLLRVMVGTLDPLEVQVMTLHYGHDVPLAVITRDLALDNPSGAKAYIVNARRKLGRTLQRRGWKTAGPFIGSTNIEIRGPLTGRVAA